MSDEETPQLHTDPEAAAEMAVRAVLRYLHECDITGDDNKRRWLDSVFLRVVSKEMSH